MESSEDEKRNILKQAKEFIRSFMYWLTDSERFHPLVKKPRLISKTYRLLGLMSSTPQELYLRKVCLIFVAVHPPDISYANLLSRLPLFWFIKMDEEAYGEAVMLARMYGLDTDLVYQQQWRKNPVTQHTIHDYLVYKMHILISCNQLLDTKA